MNPKPHPGAQLSPFEIEARLRHTAFITGARNLTERDDRPIPALQLRQRRHTRVEDRTRQAKAGGCEACPAELPPRTTPGWNVCSRRWIWSPGRQLNCFADDRVIARCEIAAVRYRILHMAARVTRVGRVVRLRLDRTWGWAKQLAPRLRPAASGVRLNRSPPPRRDHALDVIRHRTHHSFGRRAHLLPERRSAAKSSQPPNPKDRTLSNAAHELLA